MNIISQRREKKTVYTAVPSRQARIWRLETTFQVVRMNPKASVFISSRMRYTRGCSFNQHSTDPRAPHSNYQTVFPSLLKRSGHETRVNAGVQAKSEQDWAVSCNKWCMVDVFLWGMPKSLSMFETRAKLADICCL